MDTLFRSRLSPLFVSGIHTSGNTVSRTRTHFCTSAQSVRCGVWSLRIVFGTVPRADVNNCRLLRRNMYLVYERIADRYLSEQRSAFS